MTLDQFSMHRPKLHASLLDELARRDLSLLEWQVIPVYDSALLFRAGRYGAQDLVCVSGRHAKAMDGEPVWWWESDLEDL